MIEGEKDKLKEVEDDQSPQFMLFLYLALIVFIVANVYGIYENMDNTYYVTTIGTSIIVLLGILYGVYNRMRWAWFVGVGFLSLIIINTLMLGLHLTLMFPVLILLLLYLNKNEFTE